MVLVEPDKIVDYFNEHIYSLSENMVLIAENEETGFSVFLSEDLGLPIIYVEDIEGEIIDELPCYSNEECEDNLEYVLDLYINEDSEISETREDEIENRENEMENIVYDALIQIIPESDMTANELEYIVQETVDHLCEYLYKVHNISIYRPMYLEDEKGQKEFYRYPYPDMDLG